MTGCNLTHASNLGIWCFKAGRSLRVLRSVFVIQWLLVIAIATCLVSCDRPPAGEDTINLKLYQQWQLQPGDPIAGFTVVGGLGDISISLNGKSVYAPFAGRAQRDPRNCLIFSSPDIPAYLFRLCGLNNLRLGRFNRGDPLGNSSIVHVATLRKQPDGTWAIVEPSKPILERFLTPS